MRALFARKRAMTLIELLVVIAVGVLVVGLVTDALIQSNRACDNVIAAQQMHQDALLIAQSVEKTLRFRVPAEEVAGGTAKGGAPDEPAVGGDKETTPTAASSAPDGATSATYPGDAFASVPQSVKPLLKKDDPAPAKPSPGGGQAAGAARELFSNEQITICSLAYGSDADRVVCTIGNRAASDKKGSHAVLEQSAPGAPAEASSMRRLGRNSDKYRSDIRFRYATQFDGLDAQWQNDSAVAPRLVEYTVRVWSDKYDSYKTAQDPRGVSLGFTLTGAVRLP